MNKMRRAQLRKAAELLDQAYCILAEVTDEEQEAFDNMPESIQESSRGQEMEEGIYNLEEWRDSVEDIRCNVEEFVEV